jgi:D-galactose 1-dehydrogenase
LLREQRPAAPIRIAVIGTGKAARERHVPAISASREFHLVAAVTLGTPLQSVPNFRSITEMMEAMPGIQAVSVCTPPHSRLEIIAAALDHGLDILVEKPPATTVGEACAIADLAMRAGRVLYTSWHSREAAGVEPAKAWLAPRNIRRVTIVWREDVRIWHPNQPWIWESGIGVFDPGINALSIVTHILRHPLLLKDAELYFPENKSAPISAHLVFVDGAGVPVSAVFDFDNRGPEIWDIDFETDQGVLKLSSGASRMAVNGKPVAVSSESEYVSLYKRFARLLKERRSDVDLTPVFQVAHAFMIGKRTTVAPFEVDTDPDSSKSC